MIFIEILIVVGMSVLSTFLVEYISQALKTKKINEEITKMKNLITIQVNAKAVHRAKSMRDKALLSEDGSLRATFLKLTNEIESILSQIAVSASIDAVTLSAPKIMNELLKRGIVDSVLVNALENIWNVRNKVIHGQTLDEHQLGIGTNLAVVLLGVLYSLCGEKRRKIELKKVK